MPEDLLPTWAVELTKQVAILNEKIPSHIDWVERNVRDHETRLRDLEAGKVDKTSHDDLLSRVDAIESRLDQSAWAGRLGWLALGAGVAAAITTLVAFLINR